jgi:predicted nucleic acid-binding Zn ribbon protein
MAYDDSDSDDDLDDRDDPNESDMDEDDEPVLIPCPYCGEEISEDAEHCPECGKYISSEDAVRRRPRLIVIGAILALIATAVIAFSRF